MNNTNQKLTRQTKRPGLHGIASLVLALCLVGTGLSDASAAETTTLVVSGDAAPDGNGTFSGFEPVLPLNANGEVAFIASLTGTQNPSTDTRGIFIADTTSVTQLVRTGQPAPDGNGTFRHFSENFGVIEKLVLNDNATVAFTAWLAGTSGGSTDDLGLFSASASSGIKQLVRAGDSAPDGNGTFARDDPDNFPEPGLDNNNVASFRGILTGTSGGAGVDDNGAFGADGNTVTRLLRAGETVPGGSDTFETIWPGLASNLNGQVAMQASIAFDFMSGEPPGEDLERIYVRTGAVLKEVLRSGITIPEGNGTLVGFQDISIGNNGKVMFSGFVGGSDNYLLDGERLFQTDGVTLTQIARQGELGLDEQEFRMTFFIGRDSNIQNKVAFSVLLERNAVPPDNRSSAIYMADGNVRSTVLHQGDPVPGGNGTFGDIAVPLFLNNTGEIAFAAPLLGTADPDNDNRGIFFIGSDGVIQTVARFGMPLAGSTIFNASFLGDLVNGFALAASDLSLAGMYGINDAGQVAFWAQLADGRLGIFLWNSTAAPPDDDTIYADSFE